MDEFRCLESLAGQGEVSLQKESKSSKPESQAGKYRFIIPSSIFHLRRKRFSLLQRSIK